MPIPSHQSLMRPLLELAAEGQEHVFGRAIIGVAERLGVTPEDREVLTPTGKQRLMNNRLGWAKTYLTKAGLLRGPRRSVFCITERGRQPPR